MQLSSEQALIQETFESFARRDVEPAADAWERDHLIPRTVYQQLGELGGYALLVPEQYGGAQADYVSYFLGIRAIATGSASLSTVMSVQNSLVALPILHFGSDAQKAAWLTPLAAGEKLGAFGLTEPNAGSDAGNLSTVAEAVDGGYRLTGNKQFISVGKLADFVLVFAKTDASRGKKGISAFIVPTDSEGFSVPRLEEKMGQLACEAAQLRFDNVFVPTENRLGDEGQGYKIALSQLEAGRLGIAAQALGIAEAAFALSLSYAGERQTFGKKLTEHQVIRFRLADMRTQLDAATELALSAARLKDSEQPALKRCAMAKLMASEVAEKVCHETIQILGGYGYCQEYRAERYFRDVRVTTIYEGTSDVQRMIIAKEVIGA